MLFGGCITWRRALEVAVEEQAAEDLRQRFSEPWEIPPFLGHANLLHPLCPD